MWEANVFPGFSSDSARLARRLRAEKVQNRSEKQAYSALLVRRQFTALQATPH